MTLPEALKSLEEMQRIIKNAIPEESSPDIAQIRKRLSSLEAGRNEMMQDLTRLITNKLACLDTHTMRVDSLANRIKSAEDKIAAPKRQADDYRMVDARVDNITLKLNRHISDMGRDLASIMARINALEQPKRKRPVTKKAKATKKKR